jgi:hypothetical protein
MEETACSMKGFILPRVLMNTGGQSVQSVCWRLQLSRLVSRTGQFIRGLSYRIAFRRHFPFTGFI